MALRLGPQYMRRGGADLSLAGVLSSLGLLASADLAIDFGASACWPGSGQEVFDASGNGNHFYLGATGSASGDDPTISGTAGALSSGNYAAFDGGDILRLQGSNPAAFNAYHKNLATWGGFFMAYNPAAAAAANDYSFGTNVSGGGAGVFQSMLNGSQKHQLLVRNGAPNALVVASDASVALDRWNAFGFSIDESGSGFLWRNGDYDQVSGADTFSAAYSSPSAAAAEYPLEIGARGNADGPLTNGSRIAMGCLFSVAPTKQNLDDILTIIDGARGFLP